MKKILKKLSLQKHTLRVLDANDLRNAAGGTDWDIIDETLYEKRTNGTAYYTCNYSMYCTGTPTCGGG